MEMGVEQNESCMARVDPIDDSTVGTIVRSWYWGPFTTWHTLVRLYSPPLDEFGIRT